jgi:hypothetical protein
MNLGKPSTQSEGSCNGLLKYFELAYQRKIGFHKTMNSYGSKVEAGSNKWHQTKATAQELFVTSNRKFIESLVRKASCKERGKNQQSASLNHHFNLNSSGNNIPVKQTELKDDLIINLIRDALTDPRTDRGSSTHQIITQNESHLSITEAVDSYSSVDDTSISTHFYLWKHNSQVPCPGSAVDASFFVGKPVRLFCAVDNKYHVGRIIDWRRQQPILDLSNSSLHSEPDVRRKCRKVDDSRNTNATDTCSSHHREKSKLIPHSHAEFLVRFHAGSDGRKEDVYQWIVFEEHALSVGVALIWGYLGALDVSNDDDKWRPGQIMLRTALEMVPVRELNTSQQLLHNSHPKELYAFSFFFGLVSDLL